MKMIKVKQKIVTKKILREIIDLDSRFYKDFDYANPDWYYDRFLGHKIVFLLDGDKIIGYFCCYHITKRLFDKICDFSMGGDYYFPYEEVYVRSKYYYIASVVVDKLYRQFSYLLLLRMRKVISRMSRAIAYAVSEEGKRMCAKYMSKLGTSNSGNEIYVKTATSVRCKHNKKHNKIERMGTYAVG